jgi:hypothetical protein
MIKTIMMIVIAGTVALLALTPATEARKAGGTQQEYKTGPDKARAITKPPIKPRPFRAARQGDPRLTAHSSPPPEM